MDLILNQYLTVQKQVKITEKQALKIIEKQALKITELESRVEILEAQLKNKD